MPLRSSRTRSSTPSKPVSLHLRSASPGWCGRPLAATGALRRAVDAVCDVPDVGWTARLRSIPWAIVGALLVTGSLAATGFTAGVGDVGVGLAAAAAATFTVAIAAWFLARLGSHSPTPRALMISTIFLTVGLETVKYGVVFLVPRIVSRDSALYGGLGSVLAAMASVLMISWLLLIATAIAAELKRPWDRRSLPGLGPCARPDAGGVDRPQLVKTTAGDRQGRRVHRVHRCPPWLAGRARGVGSGSTTTWFVGSGSGAVCWGGIGVERGPRSWVLMLRAPPLPQVDRRSQQHALLQAAGGPVVVP